MPAEAFLEPASRKYPVKELKEGTWTYSPRLLEAAAREARMHGHSDLAARADAIRKRLGGASDRAANDRSVRWFDTFDRMHVEITNISKANVCGYLGSEIPEYEALGLDPNRMYQLYRDPEELKKAVPTFNGIQLLSRHQAVSADDPQEKLVAGTLGTDAEFVFPYLRNSMTVWRQVDIDDIESEEKIELSSSYAYKAVMEPGEIEGVRYDGRMTEIRGNHVALVAKGRAGPDVLVNDSIPLQETHMPATPRLSRKAMIVRGALAAVVLPKLAKDQKIDLKQILLGTTAANYREAKPIILRKLQDATHGKLAKDASLEEVHGLLDRLDGEGEAEGRDWDPEEETGMDADPAEHALRFLEGKCSAEDMKTARDMMDKARAARDAKARDNETEEEKEAREKREKKEAEDRAARDKAAKDKEARDKRARDAESEEEKREREKKEEEERERKEAEDARKAADKAARDKKAMDEMVTARVEAALAADRAIGDAERDIMPWVGTIARQKSAADTYRVALDHLQVDLTGVPAHPATYRAILMAHPKPGQQSHASVSAPSIGYDAAADAAFEQKYGTDRILQL